MRHFQVEQTSMSPRREAKLLSGPHASPLASPTMRKSSMSFTSKLTQQLEPPVVSVVEMRPKEEVGQCKQIQYLASDGTLQPTVMCSGTGNQSQEREKKNEKATLILPNGIQVSLSVLKPTMGDEIVIDITSLRNQTGVLCYDPGFNSVASCASAVTYIDGEKGKCLYRGYDVARLVENYDYLSISYLLITGDLPTLGERHRFEQAIKKEMLVHTRIKDFVSTFVPGAHPMSILASVLAAMASFYDDPMAARHMDDPGAREQACIRLLAKIPTIVAMTYKVLTGEPMVYPRGDLTFAENWLYMMFATPTCPYIVNPLHARVIDVFLSIHADHEQNASTSTVRTAGSSLANPFACIATGVTSLWGRAHGGANEAVITMLESIKTPADVPDFLARVKRKECRLMGFGHRVYKNTDPRALIMQRLCHEVFNEMEEPDPLFVIAKRLEAAALRDPYFVERKLYPNVDFYSGIVMRALGIPKEMFTVLFAMGRCVGWLSHWKEMVEERQIKIIRPRQLYLGCLERTVPDPAFHAEESRPEMCRTEMCQPEMCQPEMCQPDMCQPEMCRPTEEVKPRPAADQGTDDTADHGADQGTDDTAVDTAGASRRKNSITVTDHQDQSLGDDEVAAEEVS